MSLETKLNAQYEGFHSTAPEPLSNTIKKVTKDFVTTFDPSAAIQVGDKLPSFLLSDATGKEVSSSDLVPNGPLLITFYRGNWCPFCDLALHALQKHLDDFKAKGVTLVAISPELPDTSLTTAEKWELKFPVLSDVGNKFAKELGILFAQPENMRPILEGFGLDMKERYGDDSLVVPVPATLLVDKSGVVRNTFIDPDFVHRLEPKIALEWIDALGN